MVTSWPSLRRKKAQVSPGGPATDNRHPFVGGRRQGNRQSFTRIHFKISGKAFQLVDGYGVVFDAPPAIDFAWMRADPTAGQQKRIAFPDGVDGAGIVSLSDLGDVFGYVDFRGAGLPAGGQTIITLVEVQNAL